MRKVLPWREVIGFPSRRINVFYLSVPPKYLIAFDLPDKNNTLLMRSTDMHKSYPDGQMTRHHWVWAMQAVGPGLPSVPRCDVGAPPLHRGCRLADGRPGSHKCQRLLSENDHHMDKISLVSLFVMHSFSTWDFCHGHSIETKNSIREIKGVSTKYWRFFKALCVMSV